jgi:hypothetical protein
MSNSNFGAVAPELTKVAVRVLSIPTSSAAAERNWSTFSYIHDKKRNKLSNDRVFKLVYIYFNNKLKNQKKLDKTTDVCEDINVIDDSDDDDSGSDDTVDDCEDNIDYSDDDSNNNSNNESEDL